MIYICRKIKVKYNKYNVKKKYALSYDVDFIKSKVVL